VRRNADHPREVTQEVAGGASGNSRRFFLGHPFLQEEVAGRERAKHSPGSLGKRDLVWDREEERGFRVCWRTLSVHDGRAVRV